MERAIHFGPACKTMAPSNWRRSLVVEEVKTPQREVARSNLLETDPDVQLGHYVVNTIEPIHPPKFAQSVRLQETHITNLKISR